MNKKVLYTAAALLMISTVSMPTFANSINATGNGVFSETQEVQQSLTCLQKISRVDSNQSNQEYTFSYEPTEKLRGYDNLSLSLDFSEGFQPEKLLCGQWKGNDGQIIVDIRYGDSQSEELFCKSRDAISLNSYHDIKELHLSLTDVESIEYYGFSDVKVEGTISADRQTKSVTVDARYTGYYNDEDGKHYETIASGKLETQCQYYTVSQPQISLSGQNIPFEGLFSTTCENVAGNGNLACQSYVVDVKCPPRAKIHTLQEPEFNGAACEIWVNGMARESTDGIVAIDENVDILQVKVIPESIEFSQTKALIINMQDTGENPADEVIEVKCMAVYGEDKETVTTQASAPIHFEGKKIIVEPPEPEEPDTPVQPSNPGNSSSDKPSHPSGSDLSQSSGGNGSVPQPDDTLTEAPLPVTKVVDFTGMNIQNAVVASNRRSVYDFTSGYSIQDDSDMIEDEDNNNSLYEFIDDGASTSISDDKEDVKDGTKSKTAALIENNEEKSSFLDSIIYNVKNSRMVQISLIAGGIIVTALVSLFFIWRNPKA